ncbi:MAG: PfkB family carbohydrate kinase [Propionibacteriaceae bacterium]|jgi:sugar/nucleoside kinase (ribokinase family)|nr:PfkB family carbohydrate kinase [Propionibacteriaceae bacterium]
MGRLIHTAQAMVDQVVDIPTLPQRSQNTIAEAVTFYAASAVNVHLAAARSGAKCVHAGSVGTGRYADTIRAALFTAGVEISSPPITECDSGVCIVFVERTGERTFVTMQAAERIITPESLATSNPQSGDYVCVSGYSLQGRTRDPLLTWLGSLPAGVEVVLDPGAALARVSQYARDAILDMTTVWSSNAYEAFELTGHHDMRESAPRVAKYLRPNAQVIVRDGAAGCLVYEHATSTHIPAFPQRAIDTNGAGDTHLGVMIAGLLAKLDLAQSCRRANAAGAIKVRRHGPNTAPSAAEIDAFLADNT